MKVIPSKVSDVLIREGEVISIQTAGGGGFGPPLERDPELVAYDYLQRKVSDQDARDYYGVAVTEDGEVDHNTTTSLRGLMKTR
jgi:N-methylhydantoinase B